jgi:hypothetical protein
LGLPGWSQALKSEATWTGIEKQGLEMAVADLNDDFRKEEYRAHLETYERFTKLTKFGVIAVLAILVLMAIFLV